MKRFILLVPAILALSACGSDAPAPPDLDTAFSAEADITYGGQDCTAQIRRLERGIWEFCITSPYPVEGLVISVRGDRTKLTMYDMESVADVGDNAVSMARAVVTAYEAAAQSTALSGTSETGAYTLSLNESLEPSSLVLDGGSVAFTRFAPLERDTEADIILVD